MKRVIFLFVFALLAIPAAWAQNKSWTLTDSGWGRVDTGSRPLGASPELVMGEINITRWRKASGTVKADFDKKTVVISQNRSKDKKYQLLTESRPSETRDGWSYVVYDAMDSHNSRSRMWICKHENGTERILVFYPAYAPQKVYAYMLKSAE